MGSPPFSTPGLQNAFGHTEPQTKVVVTGGSKRWSYPLSQGELPPGHVQCLRAMLSLLRPQPNRHSQHAVRLLVGRTTSLVQYITTAAPLPASLHCVGPTDVTVA